MQIFLVGGAVRDKLLNFPVIEHDWVVLGETPETMKKQGFRSVGRDFPVFLHPQTQEEYALARTERKTAPGYTGFSVYASPTVSLEEDLLRRDLTINAMAMTADGSIIDPYGGQRDVAERIFRHVSPAFSEDPVRILRVARFAARYAHLGFTLAPETRALMQAMVASGEVDYLVAERVWAELFKALHEFTPSAFFLVLQDCGALARIFPEIDQLFGVPQPELYHPEIDTGLHSLLALEQAALLSKSPEVRFAALVHDLGKAVSPKANLPHHHQHEINGLPILEMLCQRLRIPNSFKNLAQQVMRFHTHCHRVEQLKPSTLVDTLMQLGAFKPVNSLQEFLLACEADARGRTGFEQRPYYQAAFFRVAAEKANAIDMKTILTTNAMGAEIGVAIRQARIAVIAELMRFDTAKQPGTPDLR